MMARAQTVNLKSASVIGFVVAVLAICGLAVEASVIASGMGGVAVQVLAALLMLWARVTFGRRSFHAEAGPTEGGLVTTGPYKFLRHPIYAAVLYFIWAGIVTHPASTSFLLGFLVTGGLAVRIYAEERLVVQRYPDYAAYAARTKRVIPFLL
jgi:protein-S-isoprenylcysteine O-methyltransferase Ste14